MTDISANQSLRFRVRPGLSVHRERWDRRSAGGLTIRDKTIDSFGVRFGQPIVDLLPDEVVKHAHALEPTDEASTAALEKLHFRAHPEAAVIDPREAAAIAAAQATVRALVEAGLIVGLPRASK